MPGVISVYTGNKILDHILKVASFSQPTNLYISLYNGDPSGAGVECPGTEYNRILCNNWNAAANREVKNTAQIDFDEIETNDWGDISYVGIHDALTEGNLIGYVPLAETYTTQLGDNLYIAAEALTIKWKAGGICNSWANKSLDHVFKNDALSVPTNLYVGASKADPTDDASGLNEPSTGDYARKLHNNWNIAASKATNNDGAITFVTATASWEAAVTHFIISDSLDAVLEGNIIIHGALGASKLIGNGDTLNFADKTLDVVIDE